MSRSLTNSDLEAGFAYATKLKEINERWPTRTKDGREHLGQRAVYRAIFNDGYKRIFIRAGRKGAKSHTSLYIATRMAGLMKGAATYIIGPQYKQQKEIMWHNGKLPQFAPKSWGAEVRDSDTRVVYPDGGFTKLDGSENYDSYRGTEYDCMVLDEFKDHDIRFYEACYPNLLARNGILVIIGTPPDSKNHYWELEQEIRSDPRWFFYHWTSWDNPFLPHGEEWLREEKQLYIKRGNIHEWMQEYEAEYSFGGRKRVYPMWSTNFVRPHSLLMQILKNDFRKLRWFTITDPGNQTCFGGLFAAYNPYTADLYLLDEIYEKDADKTSARQIFERIRTCEAELYPAHPRGAFRRFYDSAAPDFPINVRATYPGEQFSPTFKASNNKQKEITLIKDILLAGKLHVSNRCKNFISEIEDYIYEEDRTTGERVLPDHNDHLMDCLRYLVTGANYKFIESVEKSSVQSERRRYADDLENNDWTHWADDYLPN